MRRLQRPLAVITRGLSLALACGLTSLPAESRADDPPAEEVANTEQTADEPASQWPSRWITSLAVAGAPNQPQTILAATSQGLLYRPGQVVQTTSGDPATATVLYEHPVSVWAVTSVGPMIATSDYRGNLFVHDSSTGQTQQHEAVLEKWTRALAPTPDDTGIVGGNEMGKLFVWSLEKNAIDKVAELDAQQIYALAFSPDGTQLAVANGAGHVQLVAWPSLEPGRKLELGTQAIWDVAYSPDGKAIFAAGADQKLWHATLTEEQPATELVTLEDWISALQVSPDGSTVFAGLLNGQVVSIAVATKQTTSVGTLDSGVWDMLMPTSDQAFVATRKDALALLGRSWNIQYAGTPKSWTTEDE